MQSFEEIRDAKRAQRYKKDWDFKRAFYQKIDEMYRCEILDDLQYNLEFLVDFSSKIDGNEICQPLRGFVLCDLEYFLYGLLYWQSIKRLIIEREPIKQIEIIAFLELDKDKAGFFLYTISKMGILKKDKIGRNNVYSFVSDRINEVKIRSIWWLFDETRRCPTE